MSESKKQRGDQSWFAEHGDGSYAYNQDPTTMSASQVENALSIYADKPDSKSGTSWNWYQALLKQKSIYDAEARQAEYQAQMMGYYKMMAEAAARQEPAAEPLKNAQTAMEGASDDTARKQLLRRGLMSTYTRYGNQGGQRLGV